MRLGICIKGWLEDKLIDVESSGDSGWIHTTDEHVSGFSKCQFDFSEDHIVDWLIKHKYSWGLYLPENIMIKLRDKINPTDKWLVSKFNYIVRQINYNKNLPTKLNII